MWNSLAKFLNLLPSVLHTTSDCIVIRSNKNKPKPRFFGTVLVLVLKPKSRICHISQDRENS